MSALGLKTMANCLAIIPRTETTMKKKAVKVNLIKKIVLAVRGSGAMLMIKT
jgi:hypothetical protein